MIMKTLQNYDYDYYEKCRAVCANYSISHMIMFLYSRLNRLREAKEGKPNLGPQTCQSLQLRLCKWRSSNILYGFRPILLHGNGFEDSYKNLLYKVTAWSGENF